MTLQQLRYVAEIARCGSISRAAASLFVTQPSLSAAVSALENELGFFIFERSNRGIRLSPDGADFLPHAIALLDQSHDLLHRFEQGDAARGLSFSVSSQHYSFVADAFLAVMQYAAAAKRYRLSLREDTTHAIIEDVNRRKSELGVLFLSDTTERTLIKLIISHGLEFVSLKKIRPHIFVRFGHPLSGQTDVTLADLAPYPFVCYEQGETVSTAFSEELLVRSAGDRIVSVKDRATMENIITKTDAYNIGTGYIIPSVTGSGLCSIPLCTQEQMNVGYIKVAGTPLSAPAAQFISALSDSVDRWSR